MFSHNCANTKYFKVLPILCDIVIHERVRQVNIYIVPHFLNTLSLLAGIYHHTYTIKHCFLKKIIAMVDLTLFSHIILFGFVYGNIDLTGQKDQQHICFEDRSGVEGPIVHTKYGDFQGVYLKALNNRSYSAFIGVPYVDPPIGDYRFEMAPPLTPWQGKRKSMEQTPHCLQYYEAISPNTPVVGQEDCLYLDIYAPRLDFSEEGTHKTDCDVCNSDRLCPVIIFIHGGAFQFLGAQDFGAKYLMQHGNVVVCMINYRVGPLGFLSTEDEVLPGNLGLKDQVKALTFIKENIKVFGGDPSSITLIGGSAGGASLHLMYLSPLTQDLFNYGFGMSGSAFSCWAIQEAAKEKAKRLASEVGCPTDNSRALVGCLKNVSGTIIVAITKLFQPFFANPFSPFSPVIEVPNKNAFLTGDPYEMILAGEFQDKPLILSVVQKDGLFPIASYIANDAIMAEINDKWNAIAPYLLDYNFTVAPKSQDSVSQAIRDFYFGSEKISSKNGDKLVEMVSDRLFRTDIATAAALQAAASYSAVYMYEFDYRGTHSISDIFSYTSNNYGACHGDDTAYASNTIVLDPEQTATDRAMINRLVNMWISYAQTGKPSLGKDVTWRRVSPLGALFGRLNYIKILSPTEFHSASSWDYGNSEFWDSLLIDEPTSGKSA